MQSPPHPCTDLWTKICSRAVHDLDVPLRRVVTALTGLRRLDAAAAAGSAALEQCPDDGPLQVTTASAASLLTPRLRCEQ